MTTISAPANGDKACVRAEVLAGSGLSLVQAAKKFPASRNGAAVNPATIWRWITSGIRVPGGRRLRLEACRASGRWLTSEQALARFIDAQTPDLNAAAAVPPRSPGRRQSASEAAAAELKRRGC